ncbi:MAG: anti-sigma factor [Elusimicrobiales bacterium]
MKCLNDLEMTDLVSGNMPGPETAAAEEHLRDCAACRAGYSALSLAARSAAAASPAPLPEDFTVRLMARIAEEEAVHATSGAAMSSRPFVWKLSFAVCALMVLVAALLRLGGAPDSASFENIYLTDGPATQIRLTARTCSELPWQGAGPGEIYLSDSCRMAGCGL